MGPTASACGRSRGGGGCRRRVHGPEVFGLSQLVVPERLRPLACVLGVGLLLAVPACDDGQVSSLPPAAPAAVTVPASAPPPLPAAPPPLALTCTADPRAGAVPLDVTFRAF